MAWFVLLLFLELILTVSESVYVWTEWPNEGACTRSCSEASGTAVYRRKCAKCDGDGHICTSAADLYCDGPINKARLY
ncbi:hypothetical protein LSH36_1279g00023 [Paralvinella palmiformis]|uniref:Uncharacterized protein n=1 Tax=Paralvinella palmiformis TaxID=53620 RepID=A0AAD9IUB0_9ANNE|nr:hypothetical protein LSH36_1279g00023 [Paralvinella palmiformis]